jgi:HTH domain
VSAAAHLSPVDDTAQREAAAGAAVTLSDDQLERLAHLIAARLQAPAALPLAPLRPERELLTASELAERLRVSRQTVYAHALELGGERVGMGPWRFDLHTARDRMRCLAGREPAPENASAGAASEPAPARRRSRLPNGLPPAGSILASRPRSGAGTGRESGGAA